MKERPILFSGPMIRAILEGRKTQTRRVVKLSDDMFDSVTPMIGLRDEKRCWRFAFSVDGATQTEDVLCPYGTVGDRLWVRETWLPLDADHADHVISDVKCAYRADVSPDGEEIRLEYIKRGRRYQWRPSIHMPRWASRIMLEITGVRVERLQEIGEKDAIAEGIESRPKGYGSGINWKYYGWLEKHDQWSASPIHSFESLWQSINGPESWSANPWVWVIEFRRVKNGQEV